MRLTLTLALFTLLAACATGGERTNSGNHEPAPKLPSPDFSSRADLVIPEDLWQRALKGLEIGEGRMGYSREEMNNYFGHKHRLPIIENMFGEARRLPRTSGLLADILLKSAANPYELTQILYALLDARAGRGMEPLKAEETALKWIPLKEPSKDFELLHSFSEDTTWMMGSRAFADLSNPKRPGHSNWLNFQRMSPALQKLLLRLVSAIASMHTPMVEQNQRIQKVAEAFPKVVAEDEDKGAWPAATANGLLIRFLGEGTVWSTDTPDLAASLKLRALHVLQNAMLETWAGLTARLTFLVNDALQKYRSEQDAAKPICSAEFEQIKFRTPSGNVIVLGPGADIVKGEKAVLVLDLGGNDSYQSLTAGDYPACVCMDFSGDDSYDYSPGDNFFDEKSWPGAGRAGIGLGIDLSGNDRYQTAVGAAWLGTGLQLDFAGNDTYSNAYCGQGCGHAGVGALVDLEGDDTYICEGCGQGYGGTLGVGLLLDVKGNDKYRADSETISPSHGQKLSMAQGVGCGRRADFGDGHSLAGGVGMLIDGSGNDQYFAHMFAQGTGYWWGMGLLEDLGGDDVYRSLWYAQGSAAHFALGCMCDLRGNDVYNDENVISQALGNGRDGSIAAFFDGDGDDTYFVPNRGAGVGDVNGIGVFFDRRGRDTYRLNGKKPFPDVGPALGAACIENPKARSFRDDLLTLGVFLDGAGDDKYLHDTDERKKTAGNRRDWTSRPHPPARGYGLDTEYFGR